ncbi:MAG: hypothetical protein CMK32_10430 [Porticoccaceae bacterium]|nr:hypothetical protein [Porticoccaceae bacterium]
MEKTANESDVNRPVIVTWIQENLGGTVTHIEKLPRWRPSWNVEVTGVPAKNGSQEIVHLHIRGERGPGLETQPLSMEYRLLQLLESAGIPVPHIYGWIDALPAIVMEKVDAEPFLGISEDNPELHERVAEYMEILAKVHALDTRPFEDAGLRPEVTWEDTALAYLRMAEKTYLDNKNGPEPLIEFVRNWLYRNIPPAPERLSVLVGDCPQFMHRDGRVTAIYDLEMARIGDPMFDLASVRVRDINEPTGNLPALFDRYAKSSGRPIDRKVIHFYSVMQFLAVPMISGPTLRNNHPHPAFVEYLSWVLATTPRTLESMADSMGVTLDTTVDLPERETIHRDALTDLVAQCQSLPDPGGFFREHPVLSLANYARRADQLGPAIERQEQDDLYQLLGQHFDNPQTGEQALEDYVHAAGRDEDERLLRLFHRRALRRLELIQDYPAPIVRRQLGAIG